MSGHHDIALSIQVPSTSRRGLAHNVSFTMADGWHCTCEALGGHCRHIRTASMEVARLMIESEITARDNARARRGARHALINQDPGPDGPPPVDTANLADIARRRHLRDEHARQANEAGITPGQLAARMFAGTP